MTFASHFAVVTTLSGVWGIPMVAHFFNISPAAAGAPLLAFMIGNAIGSIFLGHAADRAAAALDTRTDPHLRAADDPDRDAAASARACVRLRLRHASCSRRSGLSPAGPCRWC